MNAVVQPRRRKAGISSNSAPLSWPLPRGQDLFPLYGHAMVARAGVAGARVGRFRRGRRDRGRGIAVLGRGERGGAALGHGGSIDALDDGMNACVHDLRRLHRSGIGVIVRQRTGLGSTGLRGFGVDARWIRATVFRRIAQRRILQRRTD